MLTPACLLRVWSPCALRQEYYNASAAGRRRFRSFSESLAVVFKQADAAHLLRLQRLASSTRQVLVERDGSLHAAFMRMQGNKEGWLSRQEFEEGVRDLGVEGLGEVRARGVGGGCW